mgnify:CR=1 FL=1
MTSVGGRPELFVVIMAGGASSRLWPESRSTRPKWLLDVGNGQSLLRQAYDRAVAAAGSPDRTLVVTSEPQAEIVAQELPLLPRHNIIAEPDAKDTAGCAALAAAIIGNRRQSDPNVLIALFPGDQIIQPQDRFVDAIRNAASLATQEKKIVTIGIIAQSPATGFGYIHRAAPVDGLPGAYCVERFVEKPDVETAREYLQSGEYYWNAGIFVFRYADILEQFAADLPDHADGIRRLASLPADIDAAGFRSEIERAYASWKKVSIDFGIIEGASKRGRIAVVAGAVDWSDVGSWSSIGEHLPADADGNSVRADALVINGKENIVFCRDRNKRVVLLDVSGLFVVDTPDALLIGRRESDQQVKNVVSRLKADGRSDLL